MAVKRSLVASVLLATGGSCEFTQDMKITRHKRTHNEHANNEVQYEKTMKQIKEKPVDRRQGFLDSMKKTAIDNVIYTQSFECCYMNQQKIFQKNSFAK